MTRAVDMGRHMGASTHSVVTGGLYAVTSRSEVVSRWSRGGPGRIGNGRGGGAPVTPIDPLTLIECEARDVNRSFHRDGPEKKPHADGRRWRLEYFVKCREVLLITVLAAWVLDDAFLRSS